MGSLCEAIQSVLNALAMARAGSSPSTWTPVHGWAASGGIYSIAVHGDRFVVVETDKVGSFDDLRQLLQARSPEPRSTLNADDRSLAGAGNRDLGVTGRG